MASLLFMSQRNPLAYNGSQGTKSQTQMKNHKKIWNKCQVLQIAYLFKIIPFLYNIPLLYMKMQKIVCLHYDYLGPMFAMDFSTGGTLILLVPGVMKVPQSTLQPVDQANWWNCASACGSIAMGVQGIKLYCPAALRFPRKAREGRERAELKQQTGGSTGPRRGTDTLLPNSMPPPCWIGWYRPPQSAPTK